jgi:hypothetical protein
MEKFRCTQQDRLHYNNSNSQSSPTEYWLHIPSKNEWFKLIDHHKIKADVEYLNRMTYRSDGLIVNHLKKSHSPLTKQPRWNSMTSPAELHVDGLHRFVIEAVEMDG